MKDPISDAESRLVNWYASLDSVENQAAERLWSLYFARMVGVARSKLSNFKRATLDEEEIALSAFKSFCLALRAGNAVADQSNVNLWPLLVTLTLNKAIDHIRRENRQKRGGPKASGDAGPGRATDSSSWNELVSKDPSPDSLAAATESFDQLLQTLDATGDPTLREITLLSISGHSSTELADRMGCTPRTIQRKLKTVRAIWERQSP